VREKYVGLYENAALNQKKKLKSFVECVNIMKAVLLHFNLLPTVNMTPNALLQKVLIDICNVESDKGYFDEVESFIKSWPLVDKMRFAIQRYDLESFLA
jgi:hypothetical protein